MLRRTFKTYAQTTTASINTVDFYSMILLTFYSIHLLPQRLEHNTTETCLETEMASGMIKSCCNNAITFLQILPDSDQFSAHKSKMPEISVKTLGMVI